MDNGSRVHSMKYFAWRFEVGNPAERNEVADASYFESLLAHFEQLRLIYEAKEKNNFSKN